MINDQGITIVICCYNSSLRLPATLKAVSEQKVSSEILWEVILVDNASTDATMEIASSLWKSLNGIIPFKIVHESRPGLSYAREKGIQAAQYGFIIFVDDDNWLNKDYIQNAYQIMYQNPAIGVLGGKVEAVCEIEPPVWFEQCKVHYVIGEPYAYSGDITDDRGVIYGAGMVVNKSAWVKLKESGYQSQLTDRKGTSLSSGGDVELCLALRMLGYKIYYDNKLILKHFIPKERLQWSYLSKLFDNFAKADLFLDVFQYFYQKAEDQQEIFEAIYKDKLKKVWKQVSNKKKRGLQLLFKRIPEGDRKSLFLKFYLIQLQLLLFQKKTFWSYLGYVNSYNKEVAKRYPNLKPYATLS